MPGEFLERLPGCPGPAGWPWVPSAPARYSTLSAVSSMKAASSEARTTVSSFSCTPCSNARAPTWSASSPDTISVPLPPLTVLPPASATTLASTSACGVATRTVWPEARAMNSSMVQSASSWPRPITIRWSAVFCISDIRWLDTNTVRPSAASAFIRLRIHKIPSGSSPLTGSSNMSTAGSPSRVPAMPSRCDMPRENPLVRLRATSVRPTSSSTSPTRRLGRLLVWARQSRWL